MKIDPKKLNDEGRFYYYSHADECGDEELASLVNLLPLAVSSERLNKVLEQLTDGAQLVAVYDGKKAPSGATLLGAIPDGSLFIISN